MKRYNIIGNSYQNISTMVDEKLFYTPKKGQSISFECKELPQTLIKLRDKNLIIIKEI